MGWFSGKKQTYVSSVVYNLAGDEDERTDFLKTTVIGAVMTDNKQGMGESLVGSYLRGPGIKLRNFGRWARTKGYASDMGMTSIALNVGNSINRTVLMTQIPKDAGQSVVLQSAEIGVPDYTAWADQYMLDNHLDIIDDNWIVNFDEATNLIRVTLPDGTDEYFTPAGFDKNARYLYVRYNLTSGREEGPVVPGTLVTLDIGEDFPSVLGWDEDYSNQVPHTVPLVTTTHKVVSYSDGRPNEVTDASDSEDEDYFDTTSQYRKTTYMGTTPSGDSVYSETEIMYRTEQGAAFEDSETTTTTETIAGGVIKTTTITVTAQYIDYLRKYRIDTQEVIDKSWTPAKVFIYRRNSGNAILDAMFDPASSSGSVLPFIPIRIDNQFISESYYPDIYPKAKKALKKSVGAKFDEIVERISENDSLGDIDYAYVFFGVSLNVKENACRRYLYEFFQQIMLGSGGTGSQYATWRAQYEVAHQSLLAWNAWKEIQGPSTELVGEPEPAIIPYPPLPISSVGVRGRPDLTLDMNMSWLGMDETVGSGLKKPGAKQGELWFDIVSTETLVAGGYMDADGYVFYPDRTVDHIRLNWQTGKNTWRTLDIYGLMHSNMVYGGKTIEINSIEALNDEDESGFLVPIHEDIFKSMPLRHSTQMGTACCFLVFNCYQVVKQKWYGTMFFKFIIVVIVILVSVFFPPAAGGGSGILGSNAAVGATAGFTGAAALVAGAIINAIAAMIVFRVLTAATMKLFGDKLGMIIGTIASMIAVYSVTAYNNGSNAIFSYSEMMKAENLFKLTASVGNAFSEYMNGSTMGMIQKTQQMNDAYLAETKRLAELTDQNLGSSNIIDPISLTSPVNIQSNEYSDSFLSRTLMTGSDIAELSLEMLTNFAEMTLNNMDGASS